jgi:hypothetical protein
MFFLGNCIGYAKDYKSFEARGIKIEYYQNSTIAWLKSGEVSRF